MPIPRCLRIIYGVAYLDSRWIKRQPTWLLQSILSYIGFAVLLYAWGGVEGLRNLVLAMIISGLWSTGVNIVSQSVGWYRVSHVQDMFIASPVKPIHYIIGFFASAMIFPVTTILSILPIVYILNAWNMVLLSLAIGLLVLLSGIMIGLYIVMSVEKPVNVSAITNPVSWLLVILPPVYYPASIIPEQLRLIALIPPTSAASEIIRQLTGLGTSVPIWYPATILCLWATIGVLLVSKTMKWGLR